MRNLARRVSVVNLRGIAIGYGGIVAEVALFTSFAAFAKLPASVDGVQRLKHLDSYRISCGHGLSQLFCYLEHSNQQ